MTGRRAGFRAGSDPARTALIAAAIFGGLVILADRATLVRWDHAGARVLTRPRSATLDRAADAIAHLATVEAIGAVAAIEAIARWVRGGGRRSVEPFGFVAAIPIEAALKFGHHHPAPPTATRRRRPGRIDIHSANSFPSGHVSRIAFLGARIRARRPGGPIAAATWLLALAAAWSRVYRGDHWPSDAIGGLALGTLTGTLSAWWCSRR